MTDTANSPEERAKAARSRQCGRKVMYLDIDAAKRAAKKAHKRCKAKYDAYHCGWCNGFHIGGRRKPETAKRRSERRAA